MQPQSLEPALRAAHNLIDSIGNAEKAAEQAKSGLDLLTAADLKRRKLKPADIAKIPETWLEGRTRPLYQLSEVQKYIDSKTTKK